MHTYNDHGPGLCEHVIAQMGRLGTSRRNNYVTCPESARVNIGVCHLLWECSWHMQDVSRVLTSTYYKY